MESEKKDPMKETDLSEGSKGKATADPKKSTEKKGKSDKKKPTWKRVVSGVFTAIVILLVVLFVAVLVLNKTSGDKYIFGYATFTVLTGSMEPEIKPGDVIVVKKVDSIEDLKVGDTITYHGRQANLAGKTVTHRIIRIEGDKIVTRGIAKEVTSEDPAITMDDVIGKYVKTSSFLTVVYGIVLSKYGFLFIIIIPLMILLGVQIFNFRRACKMDKDGKTPEEKSEEEIKKTAVKEKEDEIKRKAIEEYLASRKRIEKASQKKREDK